MNEFPSVAAPLALAIASLCVAACSTTKSLPTPERVEIDQFMGTWYVLGYTPLIVDKTAHNGFEHYHLAENGKIETTYQFRKDSFDGELKTMTPVGSVHNKQSNAEWRMQFLWPLKAQYIIMEVADDYSTTIVAHPNRKYAWIMARQPQIEPTEYERMLTRLEKEGFERSSIKRLPQDWSNEAARLKMIKDAGITKPLNLQALPPQ